MTVPIYANPFPRRRNVFNWRQHRKAGYQGGDDYKTLRGEPVTSPATGRAIQMHDGLHGIRILTADGNSAVIRELATNTGDFPRDVHQGEQIGTAGLFRQGEFKATHIEGWLGPIRVPFATLQAHYGRTATVKRIARYLNHGQPRRRRTSASLTGIPGPRYWRLVQSWGRASAMYPSPAYKVNGRPGPQTRKVEAHLAAALK